MNTINTYKGGVGGNTIPTHISITTNKIDFTIFLLKSIKNQVYRNIYFMCINRGFFYKKEIEEALFTNVNSNINILISKNIIVETYPKDFIQKLYGLEGYNYSNVEKMKFYKLTDEVLKSLLQFREYINYYSNTRIINKFYSVEQNFKDVQKAEELRFKRIMSKSNGLRTIEDDIFIQEYTKKQNDTKKL